MKNRKVLFASIVLSFIISFFMAVTLNQAFAANNDLSIFENITREMFGEMEIESCEYLYDMENSPDFVYIDFKGQGYVIYQNDTMEIIEYSLNGDSPYEGIQGRKYYAGPSNYYIREGEGYIDLINETYSVMSEDHVQSMSPNVTALYEENNYSKNNSVIDLNNLILATPPGSIDDGYIPNAQYFIKNPYYGYNVHGTCGSVAAQLLLSYNNYYNDRRIIAPEYLYGEWNNAKGNNDIFDPGNYLYPSQNLNVCTNPIATSRSLLGSNDTYYDHIIENLEPSALNCVDTVTYIRPDTVSGTTTITIKKKYPDGREELISKETRPIQSGDTKSDVTAHTHKGSSGADIVNGISNVLKLRISENEFEINHDRKIIGSIDSAAIKTEIDSGRPLIIGMEKSLGGEDHWVVGYGYQDYTYPAGHKNEGETYSGYIVHFGWPDKTSIWVNESWCNEYISLDIKHEHDLCVDTEKNIGNDKREIRCDECGYRTVDELYTLNQNGDMITGCKYDRVGTVVVPSQINGITITSIGNSAFANQTQITSITLPSTITSIGASAFENCTNLASINLPNGLESIGEKAFAGCTSLTKITVPESLTTMGTKAFEGCINVSEVNFNASYCNDFTADNNIFSNLGTNTDGVTVIFGNTVRKIPSYLLYELAQIKNITIADNVSEIGNYAFSGCNQITEISLPASLETFGHGVFFGCSNLSNLSIASNDMFSTENGALYTSDKSKLIYVPEKCNLTVSNLSTVEVEPYAYYNNQVVTLVNLMFVTTIGEKAFYNCKELQYVFSGSLLTIGDYALADCTKLSMFSAGINLIDMGIGVIDNTLIEKNSTGILAFGKVLYQYNGSDAVLTKQSIPSTVTKISSYAFSNNTDITEIYLPNNIDNIEQNAFYNCPNLVKVQYENFALPNINGNIFVNVDESFNFYCARILINEMSNSGSWQKYESISVPITTSVYFEDINLNQTYYYGEINYPPEGEKEGHYFYGWFEKLDENPDGTPIMATVPISIEIWNRTDTGLTYVGKYIESNNFDLIFMNGEEVVGTAHISSEHSYLFEKFGVTINGVYQDFNGKLKMDYFYYNGVFALNLANGNDEAYCEFDGWWNGNKEYTAGNTWGNAFTDSSIYLYAKWSPVEYICTLDYNGGIVQDTQIEFTYFSDIDLPIPTSTEGVFLAWEKDGQTYETLGGFIGDITLNASWKTVFIIKCVSNSYIVKTFTLTGGYTQYITLPELDYQGYYVSKWGVYAAGSDYLVIQDIILNALWEEKDIARCYNTNTSFYEIWTFNQFKAIGTTKLFPSSVEGYVILGNYRLMADITFPGTWETFTYSFSGVLDGNNKTIKRLIINSTSSSVCWGLFASIRDGEVYDLTIDVFDITLPENISSATGIIAGINDGIISNITLKNGAITCRNYESSVGGICGSNGGTVSNITIDSTVYICGSGTSLGGAVGTNYSYVENVTCSAEIEYIWNTINGSVGGIVGYNHENIEECIFNGDIYWTCEIRDKNILPSIGMICGWNEKGTLSGNDISGGTAHIDCESYYFLGIMIWDQNGRVMKKENGQTGWGNY